MFGSLLWGWEKRKKKYEANTSMMVPLVKTPREVYIGPFGFFFTPIISRLKVHLSSGCVTWALVNRNPEGRINRSYFGGFLVKPAPTNVAFVIILFHCLAVEETKHAQSGSLLVVKGYSYPMIRLAWINTLIRNHRPKN